MATLPDRVKHTATRITPERRFAALLMALAAAMSFAEQPLAAIGAAGIVYLATWARPRR